jgi:hypothetical protein
MAEHQAGPLIYDDETELFYADAGFDNRWYACGIVREDFHEHHVVPLGDQGTHILTDDCPCDPWIDEEGCVMHRAYDERELFGTGKRRPT